MSTKIVLVYPFSERWKLGYIVVNPEGRRTVILYNSPSDRSSTSYARYIMACELKRFLSDSEHVDHIDNDRTNDIIGNLQILTVAENNRKSAKKPRMLELVCPSCQIVFQRSARKVGAKTRSFCSRRCIGLSCGVNRNGTIA